MDLAFEEAERAENLMLHEDEIAARPARTWYVHHSQRALCILSNMLVEHVILGYALPEVDKVIIFIMQVSDRNPEERC